MFTANTGQVTVPGGSLGVGRLENPSGSGRALFVERVDFSSAASTAYTRGFGRRAVGVTAGTVLNVNRRFADGLPGGFFPGRERCAGLHFPEAPGAGPCAGDGSAAGPRARNRPSTSRTSGGKPAISAKASRGSGSASARSQAGRSQKPGSAFER